MKMVTEKIGIQINCVYPQSTRRPRALNFTLASKPKNFPRFGCRHECSLCSIYMIRKPVQTISKKDRTSVTIHACNFTYLYFNLLPLLKIRRHPALWVLMLPIPTIRHRNLKISVVVIHRDLEMIFPWWI